MTTTPNTRQPLPPGMYIVRRPGSGKPGLYHFGILDIGNTYGHDVLVNEDVPTIWERFDVGIQLNHWAPKEGERWELVAAIDDTKGAIDRLHIAIKAKPDYDLWGNNCEHFAKFVGTGRHESMQVTFAALAAIGIAVAALR